MAQSFELYRLSLLPRPRDLLSYNDKQPTREEYLRLIFEVERSFEFYRKTFHYVPEGQADGEAIIIGRVGRAIVATENLPPEQGLKEATRESWKASLVIIDPAHHKDGQKLGFEVDPKVGSPSGLMRALVNTINEETPHGAYHIEVQPITDDASFWKFVEVNKGEITSLTFNLIAPNMFGSADELSQEMKEFQKQEKAQKIKITLQSKDGLNTDTKKIKSSVEYATRGTGTIIAKTKRNKIYNSAKKRKRITVSKNAQSGEPWLVRAARKLAGLIGP